jgi:1-acyl-sn-glycerol-3-phosphate acyltransferase
MTTYLLIFLVTILLALALGLRACKRAKIAEWGRSWLNILDGLNRIFCRRYHRLEQRLIALPEKCGAIVAANHTSGLDALILLAASPRPLRFLIAREEYERFALHWLLRAVGCIPVDREARPERALREALRALDAGEIIVVFPHGQIHLDHHPPRQLKGGAIFLAQKSGCPIYPVRIDGIGLPGHTVLSVPIRSRVHLSYFPALFCDGESSSCLEQLRQCLERRSAD